MAVGLVGLVGVVLVVLAGPVLWVGVAVVTVLVVLVHRGGDRVGWAVSGVVVAALVVLLAAAGAFRGWNYLAPVGGEVVDVESGEPLAGARVWLTAKREFVGFLWGGPGGWTAYTPDLPWREAETDGAGRFGMGGYVGVWPLRWVEVLAYRRGYEVVEGGAGGGQVEGMEFRRGVVRTEVRIEMKRLGVEDARGWERHLETLNRWRRKIRERGPTERSWTRSPLDEVLLDEAYRYVSQGGELTEGIAKLFFDNLMPCGESPRWGNRKNVAIAWSILEYCDARSEERLCQSYSVRWAREHKKGIFSNLREEAR